jgi:hypothetical protein
VTGCTAALTVNDSGQIAGITTNLTAGICGSTDYGVQGAVVAMNDTGVTVGYQDLGNNAADAIVWPSDNILGSALATGVNQWGWVIGEQITDGQAGWKSRVKMHLSGHSVPFIWSKDAGITFLPGITATGISDKYIVGAQLAPDGVSIHGVLLSGQ